MLHESVTSSPTFWSAIYSWLTPTVFFIVLNLVIATIYITSSLTNNHKHHHQQEHEQNHHHQGANPYQHTYQHPQLVRSPSVLQRLKSINFYSYPFRSQDPSHPQTHEHEEQHNNLARSPSILQRIKSINLYSYIPTEPFSSKISPETNVFTTHEVDRTEDLRHVAVSEEEDEEEEGEENDDVLGHLNGHHEELGGGGGGGSSMDEIYRKLQKQGQGGNFTRTSSDTKPASGEVPVKLSRKMKKSASSKSAFGHFKEEDIVESRRPATAREAKPATADDDDGVDAKADDFINKFKQQLQLQRLDSIIRYKDMIGRGAGYGK